MQLLSLCSGVGGLDLGVAAALDHLHLLHDTVAYCERDPFAAAVLVARMEDTALDLAPIWDDLRTLPSGILRGRVDMVVAGIPCQPHSSAGNQQGADDSKGRDLWPATRRILRDVGASIFFLENVSGIATGDDPYLPRIPGELSEDGWDAEWTTLRASEVGAPHQRERLFLLAHRVGGGLGGRGVTRGSPAPDGQGEDEQQGARRGEPDGCGEALAHTLLEGRQGKRRQVGRAGEVPRSHGTGKDIPNPNSDAIRFESERDQQNAAQRWNTEPFEDGTRGPLAIFPPGPGDFEAWRKVLAGGAPQPALRGVADGLAYRVDRLRSCGNGVVFLQAAVAFVTLWNRLFTTGLAPDPVNM